MPYFTDFNVLADLVAATFTDLMKDPAIKQKALDSKLVVKFEYTDPEGEFWVDCTGAEVVTYPSKPSVDLTPDATLSMKADTAHAFWCGKLNLLGAMSSGEIVSEGSVPRLLKLLPVIKPAYAIYNGLLDARGLGDLKIVLEDDEDDE
jgi:putative sterol carrier protein